ncbi:MAG: DUF1905 domain-containing protein [Dyadobacter fermentans]
MIKFLTKIFLMGNNTGIEVPEYVIKQLGAGKKPPVVVTLNNYTYRNTVAVMGGKYLIALSSEHRKNAGVAGGDQVEISLQLDTEPRTVVIPEHFKTQLEQNPLALHAFEKLPPSGKKKVISLIESAKSESTRQARVDKILSSLENEKQI